MIHDFLAFWSSVLKFLPKSTCNTEDLPPDSVFYCVEFNFLKGTASLATIISTSGIGMAIVTGMLLCCTKGKKSRKECTCCCCCRVSCTICMQIFLILISRISLFIYTSLTFLGYEHKIKLENQQDAGALDLQSFFVLSAFINALLLSSFTPWTHFKRQKKNGNTLHVQKDNWTLKHVKDDIV